MVYTIPLVNEGGGGLGGVLKVHFVSFIEGGSFYQ